MQRDEAMRSCGIAANTDACGQGKGYDSCPIRQQGTDHGFLLSRKISQKEIAVLMIKVIALSLFALFPTSAFAIATQDLTPSFNWSLLEGKWAESANHQFGCRPDNLHQWFIVSADKKTITFENDRKWKIGTGQEFEQYSASIIRSHENILVIRYGSDLPGIPDEMREWEMRFIGPGTYRWRATAWREGEYNNVIGVKCPS